MMMLRPLGLAMLLSALVQPLSAQNEALRPTVSDTLRARVLARAVSEPVTAIAEPRSFQVIRVPIPEPVRGKEGLRFDIEVEPRFNVIGGRGGPLAGRAALADLLFTLGVPADASAGQRTVARAVFRTAQAEVEVPIELHVTPVHRIALITESEVKDLRLGERFELSASVRNDGNAADTIQVNYELPAGWGPMRDTVMILLPHESSIRIARISVPKNSGTGSFFVRTNASARGTSVTALTTLAVGTISGEAPPPGPVLRTSIGSVAVQNGASEAIAQIALSGPLTSSVNIDARASSRPSLGSAGIRGLSRVGSYVTTPRLTAYSSEWRASVGSTMADFSEITGLNAGGSGLSFDYNNQQSTLRMTAARPVASSAANDGGSIFGFGVGRKLSFGALSASASRLRARGLFEQSLSSVGIELTTPRLNALQFTSGLSYRDYIGASGIGMLAGLSRQTNDMNAELRVVHAPGGSSAFAHAQDEIVGNIVQHITGKLDMGGSFYNSHDSNAAARNVRSRNVGITPQYRFTDQVSVRADVRSTSYEVDGNPFSFGNMERHLGGGASARWHDMLYSTDMSLERITRTVDADDIDGSSTGDRFTWHGSAARALAFGTFGLEAGYEHSAPGTGYMPEQLLVSLRADRAQLPVGPRNLFVDAEVGYSRWSGIRTVTTLRVGGTYVLPYDMEIAAALEHNPLFYTASAQTPWVFALRIDKSVGLPRVMTGKAAGIVFQDYNGNGRRDADEPGMANVVVRRGSARATTTHDGEYRFWEQARGRTSIDPSTLPYGWVVNDRSSGDDIALVPTTRVTVVLQPGQAELMRNLDLTPAAVMARDSLGRVFIARRTSPTEALFDALPVGWYEIRLDFSAFSEPLRIDGAPPRLLVTRETAARVVVPISGRPLRFRSQ